MMRIVGRPAQLDGQTFLLGKVLGRTARGYSVRSESEVHPRRDCCAWPGGLGT